MSQTLTPEVKWAQRSSTDDPEKNYVWLTIGAPDVTANTMKLDLKPTKLSFKGYSETKKVQYEVELEFFGEIDPENSKIHHSARDIEMKLRKKEAKEEYWPQLLKTKQKMHFLKTDFDKWVDEDEQEGGLDDDYMNQFGAGGMGGADGGFGGLDFSKLGGGAGGMPDLGALGGMGGLGGAAGGDDDDDDDDEDLPDLEDEEAPPGYEERDPSAAGKAKGKA